MKKDNRSLVQTVVALLAKLQEIEILKKYLFHINENITNNLGMFALISRWAHQAYNPTDHDF